MNRLIQYTEQNKNYQAILETLCTSHADLVSDTLMGLLHPVYSCSHLSLSLAILIRKDKTFFPPERMSYWLEQREVE